MTIDQLAALEAALDAIGPEVCNLRDHMTALADHFTTDDPDLAPTLRKALTFLNRAAVQLEFMVDEVEVRQENIAQPKCSASFIRTCPQRRVLLFFVVTAN